MTSQRAFMRAPVVLLVALAGGPLLACGDSDGGTGPIDPDPIEDYVPCAGTAASSTIGVGDVSAAARFAPTAASFASASMHAVEMPVVGAGTVTSRFTAEVAARDDYAYTSTWGFREQPGNAVYVWDIGGVTPTLVDSVIIANASTTGDVQITDDGRLLVVATEYSGGSIVVYDRQDAAHPTFVSRFSTANTDAGVHTVKLSCVGARLYAFLSIDPRGGQPARLVIADLTDPVQPVEVTALTIGNPFVHDVMVRDGWLFTALWNDGLRLYDIGGAGRGGSPANPAEIGTVVTVGGQVHNVWWFHDPAGGPDARRYVFVGQEGPGVIGSSSSGDIHVVDISDPEAPREVAFYRVPGAGTHNFTMDEASGILYAAYYNGGVRALDVRGDLGSCTAAQQAADGRCDLGLMGREVATGLDGGSNYVWGVQLVDGIIYASDMLAGIYALDASGLVR